MHRHVINAICHINDILNKIIILFYLFHVKTLNHILWNISKDSPFTEVLPLFYIRFQPDFPTSSFFLSSLHLHSVTVLIMVYFSHGWGCFTHSAYSIGAWSYTVWKQRVISSEWRTARLCYHDNNKLYGETEVSS